MLGSGASELAVPSPRRRRRQKLDGALVVRGGLTLLGTHSSLLTAGDTQGACQDGEWRDQDGDGCNVYSVDARTIVRAAGAHSFNSSSDAY